MELLAVLGIVSLSPQVTDQIIFSDAAGEVVDLVLAREFEATLSKTELSVDVAFSVDPVSKLGIVSGVVEAVWEYVLFAVLVGISFDALILRREQNVVTRMCPIQRSIRGAGISFGGEEDIDQHIANETEFFMSMEIAGPI